MMRPLRTFLSLPAPDRALALETAWFLLRARLTLCLPNRMQLRRLGRHNAAARNDSYDETTVRHIAAMIRRVSRRMPFSCACLAQALAARDLLHRRGIASTLHLGLCPGTNSRTDAHAWLTVNDRIVTGDLGANLPVEVARFASR